VREAFGAARNVQAKNPGDWVSDTDVASERAVRVVLQGAAPDIPVVGEEEGGEHGDRYWLVDPLDGTTNFVHGLPFFAVAIALAWKQVPVVGVVHAPALGDTFAAATGLGATRNGRPLAVSATRELADALLVTGFSYNRNEAGRDDNVQRLAAVLPHCRDLRRLGSAALDLCLVGAGTFDAYWELYLEPYDVAAGAVVVQEAGGRVTDLLGGDQWLFGGQILASNGTLHEIVRQRLLPAPE
jgi:myo-inositol-1(or 4)-monophosphatase